MTTKKITMYKSWPSEEHLRCYLALLQSRERKRPFTQNSFYFKEEKVHEKTEDLISHKADM